jgi:thermolabile hemolysin
MRSMQRLFQGIVLVTLALDAGQALAQFKPPPPPPPTPVNTPLPVTGSVTVTNPTKHVQAAKVANVFGDSLSDIGNACSLYSSLFSVICTPPFDVPRFSNGPMWPDYLAQILDTTINPSEQGGTDFAIGGATISPENYYTFNAYATGFAMVDRFLARHGSADPRALYIVWLGGNDIDPPASFTQWNFEQLATMVGRLYDAGARKFLVPNLPDIGKLPVIINLGDPVYAQQLSDMTVLFNSLVAELPARFPEAKVRVVDVYGLKTMIDRHPRVFGFTNTTEPCYKWAPLGDGSVCPDPDEYWFWDWSHPTTRGHKVLADLFILELLRAGELRASDLVPAR